MKRLHNSSFFLLSFSELTAIFVTILNHSKQNTA